MTHKPKVLVLDDDVNILRAFQDFLKGEECAMVAASAPDEAVERMRNIKFDLLITDLRLNLESGVTFVLHAKRIQPKIPIIVITGYPDTINESELKSYGVNHFLLKPLELKELQLAVRSCLQHNEVQEQNSPQL
jgi:DNA-binding NtrC family response regulator